METHINDLINFVVSNRRFPTHGNPRNTCGPSFISFPARSDNTTLQSFKAFAYKKGLGPGLYDVHSPIVPEVSDLKDKLQSKCLPFMLRLLPLLNAAINDVYNSINGE